MVLPALPAGTGHRPDDGETSLFEEAPDELLIQSPSCWTLKPGEDWHGFQDEDIADDYCMLDPTKVTILMPGVNAQGSGRDWGIPAAILTEFLDARRVEIARTGDYTVLVLFSVGTVQRQVGQLARKPLRVQAALRQRRLR